MDNVIDWLEEIKHAKVREKDFRKSGERILEIYEDGERSPFNILYSNTETLLPALYSSLPRPIINRRFKDDDPVGKLASEAGQRMLEYLMDTDHDEYEPFSEAIENAVLDGLLPGRGVTSIKYNANVNDDPDDPYVDNEMICADSRKWDRVYFGYATKWSKVPWIAYEEYLTRDEAEKLFDKRIVAQLKFVANDDNEGEDKDREEKNHGSIETITVYQIWDKSDKTVKYVCDQYKDGYLKQEDDPLGLTGFFNCPKPITFVRKSSNLCPTALYTLYEVQAKELNRIQMRLNKIIEGIKARGCYDGNLGSEIENILKEDDNELVPTDKSAALAAQGGFDQAIWMIPTEKLVNTARELYAARESCKQVIYEITGISDIVRGQSKASETLGAQKIKESWGTMRLKRLQKEVQRYALDAIKIMLEVAVKQLGPDMWSKITNIKLMTAEEKQEAQQLAQKAQQMNQQMPPDVMQLLQKPTWDEVLKVLKDDSLRMYRLDIETNSTLDIEATEDKQLIAEFMNSLAQFMNGINPLIEKGYLKFDVARSMMLEIVRRYRFGREVEDQIMTMAAPQQQNSEEQMKQLQEQQKQLQQQQKQLETEKQNLQKQQQQFQQDVAKKTQDIIKQENDLQMDQLGFNYERKLFMAEQKLMQKEQKSMQALEKKEQSMELNAAINEAKTDMKETMKDNQRTIQSMLDKHREGIKSEKPASEKSEKQPITIVNEMPSQNKTISLKRENGQITGADVSGD